VLLLCELDGEPVERGRPLVDRGSGSDVVEDHGLVGEHPLRDHVGSGRPSVAGGAGSAERDQVQDGRFLAPVVGVCGESSECSCGKERGDRDGPHSSPPRDRLIRRPEPTIVSQAYQT
jgi:hypothetical protein